MYRLLLIIPLFILCHLTGQTQDLTLGLSTGISFDINNQSKFKHIPLSVQLLLGESNRGRFIIQAEGNIPIAYKSYDSAYTLQTGLPSSQSIRKEITSRVFTLAFGYRFFVFPGKEGRLFLDVLPVGYSIQRFKVHYKNYDDDNYEIINPDVDLRASGLVTGFGLGYVSGPWFARGQLFSPPLDLANDFRKYKLSYNRASLFQVTVGYLLSPTHPNKK